MPPLVIGLTGGIGCGKSTVTALFSQLGIDIVDADIVAREVVQPGSACLAAIAEYFGPTMLLRNGELNRASLREQVFSDNKAKLWLEQLLHPAIRQQLLQQLAACTSPYAILVAPLLLENALDKYTQRILVIDLPQSLQLQRTLKRDAVSEHQIQAIMASQLSREARLARADDIIHNDADVDALPPQVDQLHQRYLKLAAASAN